MTEARAPFRCRFVVQVVNPLQAMLSRSGKEVERRNVCGYIAAMMQGTTTNPKAGTGAAAVPCEGDDRARKQCPLWSGGRP